MEETPHAHLAAPPVYPQVPTGTTSPACILAALPQDHPSQRQVTLPTPSDAPKVGQLPPPLAAATLLLNDGPNSTSQTQARYLSLQTSSRRRWWSPLCSSLPQDEQTSLPAPGGAGHHAAEFTFPQAQAGARRNKGGEPPAELPRVTATPDNTLQNLEVWEGCGKAEHKDVYQHMRISPERLHPMRKEKGSPRQPSLSHRWG